MLSTKEIEEQIKGYRINTPSLWDREIEYHTTVPYFMVAFNKYVQEKNRVPSQEEFIAYYFEVNACYFKEQGFDEHKLKAVEARACRAYPSLVRDLHFTSLLYEYGLLSKYDLGDDVNGGIDQTIEYYGKRYAVHCYIKTQGSRKARRIKNHRHDFSKLNNIELQMDLDDSETNKIVGDFKLYSDAHIEDLIRKMQNYRNFRYGAS